MRIQMAKTLRRVLAGAAIGSALATFGAAEAGVHPPKTVAPVQEERAEAGYWMVPQTTCPYAGCTPW